MFVGSVRSEHQSSGSESRIGAFLGKVERKVWIQKKRMVPHMIHMNF